MAAATRLQWSTHAVAIWGGVVGPRDDILNKEWVEMCRVAYNPDEVTDEPKFHGFAASGEAPPTGGSGGRRQGTRGDPYAEEI